MPLPYTLYTKAHICGGIPYNYHNDYYISTMTRKSSPIPHTSIYRGDSPNSIYKYITKGSRTFKNSYFKFVLCYI